jgi:hypothetical protein
MSLIRQIVRLSFELGLAVSDYNSQATDNFDEIMKISLAYLSKVKEAVRAGEIKGEEVEEYFSFVGQSIASINSRVENEWEVVKVKDTN